jgi:hypothetical protein
VYLSRNPSLARAQLQRLRPTQLSVGYAEVQLKAAQWARLNKKRRRVELDHHVFPAVLGPSQAYFIVDHHHLGIALLEQGVDEVLVTVLDDLSWLAPAVFWRTLEFRSWSHPYDHQGRRRDYRDMPRRLTELEDDPYRSLAGLVRREGGFAKDQAPFVEFLWADFFRPRVSARLIRREPQRATLEGMRLARSGEARYLPGWTGKAPRASLGV